MDCPTAPAPASSRYTRSPRLLAAMLCRMRSALSGTGSTAITDRLGLSTASAMPMVPTWAPMSSAQPSMYRSLMRYSSPARRAEIMASSLVPERAYSSTGVPRGVRYVLLVSSIAPGLLVLRSAPHVAVVLEQRLHAWGSEGAVDLVRL